MTAMDSLLLLLFSQCPGAELNIQADEEWGRTTILECYIFRLNKPG